MDSLQIKQIAMMATIILASAAGYFARRLRLVPESIARTLMTLVVVCGYSSIGFLSVWKLRLRIELLWLPVLLASHVMILTGLGRATGKLVCRDRQECGMLAIATGLGNLSFTMGGLVAYVLYGQTGLGMVAIAGLMWTPMVVLFIYPIARHHSRAHDPMPFARLMARSILDVRSIGLPLVLVGLGLSAWQVPRPDWVTGLVDWLMLAVIATAYFSIGLRLRFGHVARIWRLILAHAGLRFGAGLAIGAGLWALTLATPWPLTGQARNILLIESFVPMAVTAVAVANMFHLHPEEASVLFVVNTLAYILLLLPGVLWILS
jgi:hypothetical protein